MNILKLKRILFSTIFVLTLFTMYCLTAFAGTHYIISNDEYEYTGREVTIKYENEKMSFDVAPIIHNDRTLLPIRALVEKAGGTVAWEETTREINIKLGDTNITMQIANNIATVNGEAIEMDVAPCIAYERDANEGRTVVPIRFVMENLGLEVNWKQDTYTVLVNKKGNSVNQNPLANSGDIPTEIKDSVRVGLYYDSTALRSVSFKSNTKMYIGNVLNGKFENKLDANAGSIVKLEVDSNSSNYIKIYIDNILVDGIEGVVQIIPEYNDNKEQKIKINDSEYRGIAEIKRTSSGLRVINIVSMQEYLYSVVPSEIVASSPIEAIKAQAVAARTYAVSEMNRHKDNDFNLCATTHCQMYRGTSWERARSSQAVNETEGVVVRYNGKLIGTFYFATSGGYTEDVENVWSGNYPYLRAVEDSYETVKDEWSVIYTKTQLEELLAKKGVNIGSLKSIETEYSKTGRVIKLTFIGTSGSKTYTKESTRIVLGLKSQMFTISLNDDRYKILESAISKLENGEDVTIAKVTTQNLNFRESNTTDSKSLRKLNTGELYEVIEINNGWAKLNVNGQIGWSSTQYLELAEYNQDSLEALKEEYENPNREFTVKITGSGSGHGVGMSQNGAVGMANAGFTYEEILKHYFTGVTVGK